jgi:ferredoxin
MTKVIINDEEYEATKDETLLKVARRNGAHIGFVCNGSGFCTACECRVLEGGDMLSELTEAEKTWLSSSRQEHGARLGCQATIKEDSKEGNGAVKVLTRSEEMKRQVVAALTGPNVGSRNASFMELLSTLSRGTLDHIDVAPTGIIKTVKRLGSGKLTFPWKDLGDIIQDANRTVSQQFTPKK